MKLIVGLDLDGVLRNMVKASCDVYNNKYDTTANAREEDVTTWELNPTMPLITDHYRFFMDNAKEVFQEAEVYEDTRGLTHKLKELGHDIAIVTHQFNGIEHYSQQWLHKNDIIYDTLHFCRDKYIVKWDVLLDDKIDNLVTPSYGRKGVCMNRNWNNDESWKGMRVNNASEFLDVVDMYSTLRGRK